MSLLLGTKHIVEEESPEKELQLNDSFDPKVLLAPASTVNYSFRRALLESLTGGCDVFLSEGVMIKQSIANLTAPPGTLPQTIYQDNRQFEGLET